MRFSKWLLCRAWECEINRDLNILLAQNVLLFLAFLACLLTLNGPVGNVKCRLVPLQAVADTMKNWETSPAKSPE